MLQRLAMAHFKLAEAARLLGQWQAPTAYRMARCGLCGPRGGVKGQCHDPLLALPYWHEGDCRLGGRRGGAAVSICSIAPPCLLPSSLCPKTAPSSAPPRSLSHDVLALERIARLLSRKIWGQLKCEGATSLTSVWWAPVGAGLAWPLAVWVRRKLTNVYARKADKIY